MGRYRSRSRSQSRSYSPVRRKRYDDLRDQRRERRSSPAPSGLLVRNISLSARPEELRIPFERFGPIRDVYLPKNYYTGEPRGFGFVKFRNHEDAAEAKTHLNHTVIGGREIRIVFAEENRKAPHEMRRVTHVSNRGSYRRRSPSMSTRRRYRSYSRSLSPARRDSRDRDHGARKEHYSSRRSRSISRSVSPREERSYRSHERSPGGSGSLFLSHSLINEKDGRPSRQRSIPRDNDHSARDADDRPSSEKAGRSSRQRSIPRDNGHSARDVDDGPSRSKSPHRNPRSTSRSRSRPYSSR